MLRKRGDCLSKTIKLKKRRRPKPLTFKQTIIISFIIFIIFSAYAYWLVDQTIRPIALNIATIETQKIAMSAINHAVQESIEDVNIAELIEIQYDNDGNVSTVGFDSHVYNQVVTQSVANVKDYIYRLERGGLVDGNSGVTPNIVYEIPLGQVANHVLLSRLGPKIPVKMTAIGEVHADLNENIIPSGINNVWIRVSLDLDVKVQVILPFASEVQHIVTTVPVGMVYISGKVPHYYGGGSHQPIPAIMIDEQKDAP